MRRVLDDLHVFALPAGVAQGSDSRGGILQQPLLELGIDPGAGDNLRPVARPDFGFVGVNERVNRRRIDQPFLDQQRLQRLDAQHHIGGRFRMVVRMVVMLSTHGRILLGCAGTPPV